jgi:BirA family biotin operon repressor/biotin-[acetyl-CoA-carboxylase] ligase
MSQAARSVANSAGPVWILGLEQTAGKGRRGRPWTDPPGNFAASLLMHPQSSPDQIALRSFVAALALQDAFIAATGRPGSFALKWPNDVLLNGGKVAGILLESLGIGAQVAHLIIGFGVNLVQAPARDQVEAGATPPVSLLSETGTAISPEDFLNLLAPAFAKYEAQFTTYGFEPIRTAWLANAAKLGETITARTMTDSFVGRFETVDAGGNLVLQTAHGRRAIPAADIFF